MKRFITCLIFGLFFIFLLILYNQYQFKQNHRFGQSVPPAISFVSLPLSSRLDQPVTINWLITAPEGSFSSRVSLFYGPDSSPSALPVNASPEAVGYPHESPDYKCGSFRLPDTFTYTFTPTSEGVLYYRAYSKIGNDHIWSAENQLVLQP